MNDRARWIGTVLLVALLVWSQRGGGLPIITPAPKATAATYVYEQRQHAVPAAVIAGLDQLNRRGITATMFDDDSRDGTGEVPDQYEVPLKAATDAGLPALVVTGGEQVIKVVKNPTTLEAIVGAVP